MLAAQSIPLPDDDEHEKSFHPYVKIEIHAQDPRERAQSVSPAAVKELRAVKEGKSKAQTKTNKGLNPDFGGEALVLGPMSGVVEELAFVRFTVKDDDILRDDLAAWACIRLDRLRTGYRFVHLLDGRGVETEGVILVRVARKELV